uniref:Uncharacterized protein n=1 Tax=Anguilla anguilla TaxID=7936 RepID=A0A0E9WW89_ANGAN
MQARSFGKRRRAFCVVTSTTLSSGTPLTLAMNSAQTAMFRGSFLTCFSGPKAGESVSRHMLSKGNCFTSFCCSLLIMEGGMEKKYPAFTPSIATEGFPSKACRSAFSTPCSFKR